VPVVFLPSPIAAAQLPASGARCFGPSLPLGSNLPLATTTSETDVVDTHIIPDAVRSRAVAWCYRNLEGDRFIQVRPGFQTYVAHVLSANGANSAAEAGVASELFSFIPVKLNERRL
jgi:hypothetical protein